jgi:uncharacterized protein DUF3108
MLRAPQPALRRLALAAAAMTLCVVSGITGGGPRANASAIASPAPSAKPRPHRAQDPIPLPADLPIPRYRPGAPPFADGETLVYDASWIGIPAAEARITLAYNRAHPELWTGQMWITSNKAVDLLYRMRDYFRENFHRESFQPDDIYILQHEKKRRDEWRVAFDHGAHLVTSVKRNAHGRIWTRRFSGGDPWGPFSGAMMALSQPLRAGQSYTFDVFSGGNRYVFAFTVVRRERITTALGTFDTLRIEPSVLWLSEGSFRSQARETTLWVTNDARHLPVRIACAVFIGEVVADLVKVTNAPASAPTRTAASSSTAQSVDP